MSLARSASGPGGLSINTGSANSLFGGNSNTTQPAASSNTGAGGLFGGASNTTQQQPAATGSSLFGNAGTSNTTQSTGGGLFGSNNNNNNNATSTANSTQQTGNSLFGGANTTNNNTQPAASSGGLFGQASNQQSQPQQQQQSTGGGLFGSNTQQSQLQQSTGGGLFGSNTNTQQSQPQQATGGGLFGASNQQSQPQQSQPAGGGLFGGATQTQTSTSTPSLFGQTAQQPKPAGSILGGGLGQSTQQQTVPGVRIDLSNIKGTTRFSDLQENLQKTVEDIDKFILGQISHQEELQSFIPAHGDMLENVPNDVKFVTRKYEGARNALESDAQAIEGARALVNQDADHARLSFRAIDNLKLPQQYHTPNLWAPRQTPAGTANTETDGQDLVGFFSKTADDMDEQLRKYQSNLGEIESHMHGVQDGLVEQLQRMMATKNGSTPSADDRIQELVTVLREFEQSILKVAADVGSAREGMMGLQVGEFLGTNPTDRSGVY